MLKQLLSAALQAGIAPHRAAGISPTFAPRNASQQDTDPGNQRFSAAALFCCDSSWERHSISSAGMEFGSNFKKSPPKANKKPQQKPHHLHRFLLQQFKHTYPALCAFSPGSDSRTLTLGHAKDPGCPHRHARGTGAKSPASEVASFLLFSRICI